MANNKRSWTGRQVRGLPPTPVDPAKCSDEVRLRKEAGYLSDMISLFENQLAEWKAALAHVEVRLAELAVASSASPEPESEPEVSPAPAAPPPPPSKASLATGLF